MCPSIQPQLLVQFVKTIQVGFFLMRQDIQSTVLLCFDCIYWCEQELVLIKKIQEMYNIKNITLHKSYCRNREIYVLVSETPILL